MPADRHQVTLASLVLCLSLTGCVSLQWRDGSGNLRHWGALRFSFIDTDSARVFVRETAGLDLRFTSSDPGVSLGYRKYIAVQPRPSAGPVKPASGYFWVTDQVSGQAGLLFKKVWGTELGFGLLSNGLSVGYDRTTLVVGPKADESAVGKIDFNEGNLSATRFVQRSEKP